MKKLSLTEFINKANLVHENKYDYSDTIFTSTKRKISIICPFHGSFLQLANNHLQGSGCSSCGKIRSINSVAVSKDEFVSQAQVIHGDKYCYDHINFVNMTTKISIFCHKHKRNFWQLPSHHVSGQKCPQCARNFKTSSAKEHAWLDSLGIPKLCRQINLSVDGRTIKPDAYDSVTNTIYEFYGDFWHGNPKKYNPSDVNSISKKTFGELYNQTICRERMLRQAGFHVVSMWESDFHGI